MPTISERASASIKSQSFQVDPGDRDHLRETWRLAALEWSRLEDVASRLEEGRRIVIAEIELELIEAGERVTHAERKARTSDRWRSYLRSMHDARRAANDAKIAMQNADRVYWSHATHEANERAEKRMSR